MICAALYVDHVCICVGSIQGMGLGYILGVQALSVGVGEVVVVFVYV